MPIQEFHLEKILEELSLTQDEVRYFIFILLSWDGDWKIHGYVSVYNNRHCCSFIWICSLLTYVYFWAAIIVIPLKVKKNYLYDRLFFSIGKVNMYRVIIVCNNVETILNLIMITFYFWENPAVFCFLFYWEYHVQLAKIGNIRSLSHTMVWRH